MAIKSKPEMSQSDSKSNTNKESIQLKNPGRLKDQGNSSLYILSFVVLIIVLLGGTGLFMLYQESQRVLDSDLDYVQSNTAIKPKQEKNDAMVKDDQPTKEELMIGEEEIDSALQEIDEQISALNGIDSDFSDSDTAELGF